MVGHMHGWRKGNSLTLESEVMYKSQGKGPTQGYHLILRSLGTPFMVLMVVGYFNFKLQPKFNVRSKKQTSSLSQV